MAITGFGASASDAGAPDGEVIVDGLQLMPGITVANVNVNVINQLFLFTVR